VNEIANILVPIYECRDAYPAYDYALWLAKMFQSHLLVAAVVRKRPFIRVGMGGPVGMVVAAVDEKGLERFRVTLTGTADRLVSSAKAFGLHAESIVTDDPFPDVITVLTRQCDLLVESRLHRHAFLERKLLDERDIYTDPCCPILVTKGEPFAMAPVLLIYSQTQQANRGLRWFTRLVEKDGSSNLSVLTLFRKEEERDRLLREVVAFTKAHGVNIQVDAVMAKDGFFRAVELARKLRPGIVAMPMHAFPRPLRLRIHGIDMKALNDIQASVLLFP
jgi:ElaB/YqjD/DUF883 family membrane-anchored ribosome-binding protein